MKYVFGPVPSRRLGKSLEIDPIPRKTCNWNCIYCQLGRTRPLTNTRRDDFLSEEILVEVETALASHQVGEIDWVAFAGSGEPTLCSGLGWLIRRVKALTNLPVAVITNGALLYLRNVRSDLAAADAVLPSLDAGNPRLYRKINRPWPKLSFERVVKGLAVFRQTFAGKLWVEVMLLRGLNDTDEALHEIAAALEYIRPDEVHLQLPTRPPAESWVQPADESGLQRAQAILGEAARVAQPVAEGMPIYHSDDLALAILGVISRHPMPESELCAALGYWPADLVQQTLGALRAAGKAQVVTRRTRQLWSAAGASTDSPHQTMKGEKNESP